MKLFKCLFKLLTSLFWGILLLPVLVIYTFVIEYFCGVYAVSWGGGNIDSLHIIGLAFLFFIITHYDLFFLTKKSICPLCKKRKDTKNEMSPLEIENITLKKIVSEQRRNNSPQFLEKFFNYIFLVYIRPSVIFLAGLVYLLYY